MTEPKRWPRYCRTCQEIQYLTAADLYARADPPCPVCGTAMVPMPEPAAKLADPRRQRRI